MNFKIGDRVKVIDTCGDKKSRIGMIGYVIDRYNSCGSPYIQNVRINEDLIISMYEFRFALAKPLIGLEKEIEELETIGYR